MKYDAIVVGSGIGGLSAAITASAAGLRVLVLEAAERWGGKAGVASVDGVEFDTGPSLLTLPFVFDELFRAAGSRLEDEITLRAPEPAFRYLFPSGAVLDMAHDLEETLGRVEALWGRPARDEFSAYLGDTRRIWESARPHFVDGPAPDWKSLLQGGPGKLLALGRIDPFRTMREAIVRRVKTPELVMLLERFATYNGSDVRRAPATLGCIAHVELALGGYGVEGGMARLADALGRAAVGLGVDFEFRCPVERVLVEDERVIGVASRGFEARARSVVINADVRHLFEDLLPERSSTLSQETSPSMSAYNAVYRARRQRAPLRRPAHAVVFPPDYLAEFADIFDARRSPRAPAVYVCAQEVAQGRRGWAEQEPLFVMANSPPVDQGGDDGAIEGLARRVESRLLDVGWIEPGDGIVWRRGPRELAERFPGSRGALYGAASNDKWSAFRRAPNELKELPGLFLASGSVHPGGGLPLVARSGQKAARALLRYQGKRTGR